MKKWIAVLIAGSLGSAFAADKVHVGLPYVGFSTDLSPTTEVRFTAGLYQLDVAAPIRLSSDASYVYAAPQVGFGWTSSFWSPFGKNAGFSAGANLGYNYLLNEDWRIYGEAGPALYFGSGGVGVGLNVKIGASFTLR
ncbi:hypothetical protein [Deinococcus cellulosilyticus]|uniref:Outer membrane protein beta-barrel domain-containing protein n=1 Tax=Deinococcus cellulosilyticus (strain DSM 18568 / NBRC 106333 / KACC 11606 / 5516J-15) TaxID=1223518 RepID=A0A511NA23_DEIC1|nr:hypothetical protein [Deinococcus cellulosilyticus]GEM49679.1 hypothetical protein DC3_53140 [Deinococcus cellulosilyticus NBRC 106333 = KACC 11606]